MKKFKRLSSSLRKYIRGEKNLLKKTAKTPQEKMEKTKELYKRLTEKNK
jgi:hypothetical protein